MPDNNSSSSNNQQSNNQSTSSQQNNSPQQSPNQQNSYIGRVINNDSGIPKPNTTDTGGIQTKGIKQ